MKTRAWQIAGVLALVGVLGKFYAPPLMAQVRAALVQDRDAVGRNLYQAVLSCNNTNNPCVITFPAVPAGKRLIITQVSAIARMAEATSMVSIQLRGGSVFQFVPVVATPNNFGGEFEYVANGTVLAGYEATETPNIDAFAATSNPFTVLASISGYMIDIP